MPREGVEMIDDEVEQTIVDLEGAIEHAKNHNWGQGQDYEPETGAFCAYGSIRAAVGGLVVEDGSELIRDWAYLFPNDGVKQYQALRLRDRSSNVGRAFKRILGDDITSYNDTEGRTKAEVISAMETVLIELRKDPSRA